jgi:hypothetical protein
MFPIIFVAFMFTLMSTMLIFTIKEEINSSILQRIYATYFKRIKRRKKCVGC